MLYFYLASHTLTWQILEHSPGYIHTRLPSGAQRLFLPITCFTPILVLPLPRLPGPHLHSRPGCMHVYIDKRGIFPFVAKISWVFSAVAPREVAVTPVVFQCAHLLLRNRAESAISFTGTERLSEGKKLYPCQDCHQPLFLLSKPLRPLYL